MSPTKRHLQPVPLPSTRDYQAQSRTEPDASPLEPLFKIAMEAEVARKAMLAAAKIADENNLPALHLEVVAIRCSLESLERHLAEWVSE